MNKRKQGSLTSSSTTPASTCANGGEAEEECETNTNTEKTTDNKRLAVASNDAVTATEAAPEYGKKSYWDERYKFYCRKYREQAAKLVGAEEANAIKLEDAMSQNTIYKSEAGHSWYFTYEEIRTLLVSVITSSSLTSSTSSTSSPSPKKSKSDPNIKKSIIEIGCGDVPMGSCIQNDKDINSLASRIVCCDYSPSVIALLKQLQSWNIQPGRTLRFCGGNDIAPKVEYVIADATEIPYPDNSFDIVMDKGTLDAMLSDKVNGVTNSIKAVAEMARVFNSAGAIFIVSHLNCSTHNGLSWLHEVVVSGLKKHCAGEFMNWHIEAHGKIHDDHHYYACNASYAYSDSEGTDYDTDESSVDLSIPPPESNVNDATFQDKSPSEEGDNIDIGDDGCYTNFDSNLLLNRNQSCLSRQRAGPMVYIIRNLAGHQKQTINNEATKSSGISLNIIPC